MPTKNQIAATLTAAEAARSGVLTADVAQGSFTTNMRKQYGFTRKLVPTGLPTEPKLYISSISEYGFPVDLGPGFPKFEVKACPDGDDFSEPLVINPIYFFEEAKVDVTEHTFHSGQQIADAIMMIGPGMAATLDRRKIGWLVSSTNPPSDAELEKAKEIFLAECQNLIRQADSYYARNQLNEINEMHRRAAKYCKQTKKAWVSIEYKMVDCPGCMEPVREGMIWHATPQGCGYIFNEAEFKKHFRQAPAPQQRTEATI